MILFSQVLCVTNCGFLIVALDGLKTAGTNIMDHTSLCQAFADSPAVRIVGVLSQCDCVPVSDCPSLDLILE